MNGRNDYNRGKPNLKHIVIYIGLAVVLAIGTVAGAYVLEAKQIRDQNAAAAKIVHQQQVQSVKGAIPLCQALVDMDNASIGATNATPDQNSYGHRLAAAIHVLVINTKCEIILRDIKNHDTYQQIERSLK